MLRSAVLFLILLFPNVYACFVASDLSSPVKAAVYLLVACIGLALPMLLFRRRTYFILVGVLCLFCAPIELASLYLNHNPATATFVGLFYATNWQEVMGIIGVIWPLGIGLVAVWVIYFLLASRQPNEWIIPRRVGLWTAGIGIPVLFGGAIIFFSHYARNLYNLHKTEEIVSFAKELTLMKFYKIYPYNIYLNTYHVAVEHKEMLRDQQAIAPFRFGLTARTDSTPELYILVVGEAARSDHFALNGYPRETTPRLSQRKNIVSYPHIYSQAGTTEVAVPHMLSRLPITRHAEVYKEKTLPEAFQEAGFKTSWLTNQSRILSMERVKSALDYCFETGKDISVTNNYDGLLLSPLHDALTKSSEKQFILLHTMGSHWRYDSRYTEEFEVFKPSLGQDFNLTMINPANKQRLVNAYDNSIVYTDWFLDSICSLAEQKHIPALVIYMSDHGENLYDDERNLILHGNYSTSKWLFHVPMIVWYSDEYAVLYPDKINQLKAHAACRDNSSMLFTSMIDAAGLHYINNTASDTVIRTRSIFSKEYCTPDTLFVLTTEEECIVWDEK